MWHDEIVIATNPPNTRLHSPVALKQWSRVNSYTKENRIAGAFTTLFVLSSETNGSCQFTNACFHHIMVVTAISVIGKLILIVRKWMGRVIIKCQTHNRAASRQYRVGVIARIAVASHVVHPCMSPFTYPTIKRLPRRIINLQHSSHTTSIKAEAYCFGFDKGSGKSITSLSMGGNVVKVQGSKFKVQLFNYFKCRLRG